MTLSLLFRHSGLGRFLSLCLFVLATAGCRAAAPQPVGEQPARTITFHIGAIKLYKGGDQGSFPSLVLGSNETLELHFDDLDGGIKNYYYSFELCNADWSPSVLRPFEYTKGFQSVRISNYRNSSLATTRYTHYQASVPDRNSYPNRSGNYLLKVFVNNDPTRVAFVQRFVVIDAKAAVAAQLLQPYNATYFRTHQKIQVVVNTDSKLQVLSPQDFKVVVLQNSSWATSVMLDRPSIYRGNYYEYTDDEVLSFPGGKEWRWVDLRSFRLLSDRVERMATVGDTTIIYVKPDVSRNAQIYAYYRDLNGRYAQETLEGVNPFWQGDYGTIHFTYVPPNGKALEGKDVYVFGELTDYSTDGKGRMVFNAEKGIYETDLFLKQGYYSYRYITRPARGGYPDASETEGNYFGTENQYTVLVYYRPFGARADELVGAATLNSTFQRGGF